MLLETFHSQIWYVKIDVIAYKVNGITETFTNSSVKPTHIDFMLLPDNMY
jgi:hypothetical protein